MLVLSRKLNEKIVIDGNIEVTVIAIHQGKVRLGVKAPKRIAVHRQEVQRLITEKNGSSGSAQS